MTTKIRITVAEADVDHLAGLTEDTADSTFVAAVVTQIKAALLGDKKWKPDLSRSGEIHIEVLVCLERQK